MGLFSHSNPPRYPVSHTASNKACPWISIILPWSSKNCFLVYNYYFYWWWL